MKSRNPIDVHVGARVRLRRMTLGISQEKLGEWLGLTFQQIQKYEKGANRIGASRLFAISQRLGVPVQFFFDGLSDEEMNEARRVEHDTTPLVDLVSSAEGFQLNAAFSRIEDPETRKRIVELVKTLSTLGDARSESAA
ncbi:MAG: helix-turn-helix transcriptional regulator [Pseudomonadota bacterium]